MALDPASFEPFRLRATGQVPASWFAAREVALEVERTALADMPEAELWRRHADGMEVYRGALRGPGPASGEASLLDLKVELGQRMLGPCRLCWLRCPVDRRVGQVGACGLGRGLRPYRDFVHLGEELELIPTQALYLAGCNYRCVYCSDWDHVDRPEEDPEVEVERVSRSIEARRREGALSVSFIGGLPDVNLPAILQVLQGVGVSVPVVWNTNLSGTREAHDLLEGVVCAYVADLKYGGETCARAGSGVKDSLEVVQRNLLRVRTEAYLIVRHLVMPGHVDCCTLPALDWLAEQMPGVRVNLMDQYMPVTEVRGTAWDRRPRLDELTRARRHAEGLPLDLVGPGRIESLAAGASPSEGPDHPPVAAFESSITIDASGGVTIENLAPGLAGLTAELGGTEPDLLDRRQAARPWRPAEEPGPGTGVRPPG